MKKYIAHIYIFLMVVYYGQGYLSLSEGIIGKLLLVLIVLFSLYYWIYAIAKFKLPIPLNVLNIMLVIWTFYGIYPIMVGSSAIKSVDQPTYYYLKNIYISILPIYSFYVFTKKKMLTEYSVKIWYFAFLLVAIMGYIYNQQMILQALSEGGRDVSEITNNAGYTMATLLCLLPLFNKKPLVQYSLMAICLYFVLVGFKRGAIICAALCAIMIIIHSFKMSGGRRKKTVSTKWKIIVITIVLLAASVYAINMLIETSDYFNYRLESTLEGRSSERDNIYSFFYEHFTTESNPIIFLFGNGAYGTIELYRKFAHNDWLEIAIDNGLVFLLIYAIYWVSILSVLSRGEKKSPYTLMLATFVIIYLFRTFVSMSYSAITPYAALAFGMSLANFQCKKNYKRIINNNNYTV